MADPTGLAGAIAKAYQARLAAANNPDTTTCPNCGHALPTTDEPSSEQQLQDGVDKDVLKK